MKLYDIQSAVVINLDALRGRLILERETEQLVSPRADFADLSGRGANITTLMYACVSRLRPRLAAWFAIDHASESEIKMTPRRPMAEGALEIVGCHAAEALLGFVRAALGDPQAADAAESHLDSAVSALINL